MDSIFIHFLNEENEERFRLRELRDASNPMQLPISRFIKKFRLSKEAFRYLTDAFINTTISKSRSTSIPAILKIAAALRFFAQGSYQESIGESYLIGMSQSTFSTILADILSFMESEICSKWISFRMSADENKEIKKFFYEILGFPGVIGCVDGTHVSIIRPNENEHLFFGKEGHHTINTMIVCDHNMRIRSVDGRYGGASHDALIWALSAQRRYLEIQNDENIRNWLLGDSGYPLEPWLITPYRIAEEGSRNAIFNTVHAKARSIVERTIGLLKGRFRCICGERKLHYQPLKVTKIINSCRALHNIAIHFRVPFDEGTSNENLYSQVNTFATDDATAVIIRDNIRDSIC